MRSLITGATGLVGRRLLTQLDEAVVLLETLYEGWKECRPEPAAEESAIDAPLDSAQPEWAGQAWTL